MITTQTRDCPRGGLLFDVEHVNVPGPSSAVISCAHVQKIKPNSPLARLINMTFYCVQWLLLWHFF